MRNAIASQEVGRYTVDLVLYKGEPCYQVWNGSEKVRCFTRAQEYRFPKRAAEVGTALVEGYRAAKGGK